ncbi:MAG: hypothetical protein K2Y16_12345 [Burkholderiales bacterium]|nr:hypothetical protein [Burkholderiales bacterium]
MAFIATDTGSGSLNEIGPGADVRPEAVAAAGDHDGDAAMALKNLNHLRTSSPL